MDHVADAGAHALDVFGEIHGLGKQRVVRDGGVRAAQFFDGQGGRQGTGIPNFQAVLEEHDLHAGVAGVVTVHDGVDDGLGDNLLRDFVFRRHLGAVLAGADPEIDFGEHEILGLVHEVEDRALVHLIGRDGLGHFIAVEVGALDLGRDEEPLRLFAEQQHGGVGRPSLVEQVEVGQHFMRRGVPRQREIAPTTGQSEKAGDLVRVQIVEGSVPAKRGIKGPDADQFALFEDPDQTGVGGGNKFFGGIEPPPDEAAGGIAE